LRKVDDRPQTGAVDWLVRRATLADAEAMKAVAGVAWRDTYRGLLRDETIEAFIAGPYDIESVRRRIDRHHVLVAMDKHGIVAYADAVPEDERLLLAAFYALPDRRRQGAGGALLEALLADHPGLPIDACVLVGNRAGEAFYERRGFAPVETIEGELFGEAVTERRWRRPAIPLAPEAT